MPRRSNLAIAADGVFADTKSLDTALRDDFRSFGCEVIIMTLAIAVPRLSLWLTFSMN